MIYAIEAVFSVLESSLEKYFNQNVAVGSPSGEGRFVLGNAAQMDASESEVQSKLRNRIIISLVNIEEESALKNYRNLHKNHTTGSVEYENPPVFLNLYILFSAHFQDYKQALRGLSLVVRFFQGRNRFQFTVSDEDNVEADETIDLSLDLYTMTFVRIIHVWGSLGGKQVPFAMYKARLVSLSDHRPLAQGKLIDKIDGNLGLKK